MIDRQEMPNKWGFVETLTACRRYATQLNS